MKHSKQRSQAGFALLLFVLVILGLGGVAFVGYSSSLLVALEKKNLEHDKQVLQEAKQALLLYAFRYPEFNQQGTGRLPCPDITNDGKIGGNPPQAQCEQVGRLPIYDLNLDLFDSDLGTNDPRDSSGERLWYAVSHEFRNSALGANNIGGNTNGPSVVNSDSVGTISIYNQSGATVYDGSVDGVAAILIAPGPAIRRDDANNDGIYEYDQVRGTAAEQIDPRNYLDTFTLDILRKFDNSNFVNGSNTIANSFIHGPIVDNELNVLVNDRIVVITTDEIVTMAEKGVLHAYQEAIREYRDNTGNNYPWLDSYATADVLTTENAEVGTRVGQVPSIHKTYFSTAGGASPQIESDIRFRLNLTVNGNTPALNFDRELLFSPNARVWFRSNGDLRIRPSVDGVELIERYWDDIANPSGWKFCPPVNNNENDCNQRTASPGVLTPNLSNQIAMQQLEVTYDNNLGDDDNMTLELAISTGSPLQYSPPSAVPGDHAYIYNEYFENNGDEINIGYVYDDFYLASFDDVESEDHVPYLIGIRYYPVLGEWIIDNDWHNSILMAYSEGYQPGSGFACNANGAAPACLTVLNSGGVVSDKEALLVLASDHNITNVNPPPGYVDDLPSIFDAENADIDIDDVFDARVGNGNDTILILDD